MPLTPKRERSEAILEVARRDQLAAGGGGDPVDFGDDRLREVDDRLHEPRAKGEAMLKEGAAMVGVGPARGHFLEVVPGREEFSRSGDDDDTHAIVVARKIELRLERLHRGNRQGIGRRVLQRQPKNMTVALRTNEHEGEC